MSKSVHKISLNPFEIRWCRAVAEENEVSVAKYIRMLIVKAAADAGVHPTLSAALDNQDDERPEIRSSGCDCCGRFYTLRPSPVPEEDPLHGKTPEELIAALREGYESCNEEELKILGVTDIDAEIDEFSRGLGVADVV